MSAGKEIGYNPFLLALTGTLSFYKKQTLETPG